MASKSSKVLIFLKNKTNMNFVKSNKFTGCLNCKANCNGHSLSLGPSACNLFSVFEWERGLNGDRAHGW